MPTIIRARAFSAAASLAIGCWGGCAAPSVESEAANEYFAPAEVDVRPVLTAQAPPVYPRRSHPLQGKVEVTVSFVVDENGRVVLARIEPQRDSLAHDPAFDAAALAAVSQWRFRPGLKSGKPVRVAWQVPIEFKGAED